MARQTVHSEHRREFPMAEGSDRLRRSAESAASIHFPRRLRRSAESAANEHLPRRVQVSFTAPRPLLVLTINSAGENRWICRVGDIRIRICPDRKRSRLHFAGLYYQNEFKFGASALGAPEAFRVLSERKRWLYNNDAMLWMPLNRIFSDIYLTQSSKQPSVKGENHVSTFTCSHIKGESHWFWEIPSLR